MPDPPMPEEIQYHTKMTPGMNCDFEDKDQCTWNIVPEPSKEQRKVNITLLIAEFPTKGYQS